MWGSIALVSTLVLSSTLGSDLPSKRPSHLIPNASEQDLPSRQQSVRDRIVRDRADAISAAMRARAEVLNDSTSVGSCSIYRALDSRSDYLSLLHAEVRSRVLVAAPEPCSPDAISADTTLTAYEWRRLRLKMRPISVEIGAVRPVEGNTYAVEVNVSKSGVSYDETHVMRRLQEVMLGNIPMQVSEIRISNFIIH